MPPHNQLSELLSTKLTLPRLRPSLVARDSLLSRLDTALEHRLTLISAPAGFGKTTLVRSWVASRLSQRLAVAWVALDPGDNDPIRFWHYLIAACQNLDPLMSPSAQQQLLSLQRFPFAASVHVLEPILIALINALAILSRQCVLILEDFHVITEPQIHETLAYFLEHLPASTHLMILSRGDLPHALAHLRAENEIFDLSTIDLRFSLQETQSFLERTLPFPFAQQTLSELHERTEGWVAGLQLVALALQKRDAQQRTSLLATLSGRYRPLMEYLLSEVFTMQPEPIQTFLLQTTHLSRLTGSLCDAVTGRDDGNQFLEIVERTGLFLEPLDGSGQWYRYHALFAEAMQQEAERRLGAEKLLDCARKASDWYEQHGLLSEAIESALSARSYVRAATLIEWRIGEHYFSALFERYTWARWLKQLPDDVIHTFPDLCFISAVLIATPELCARLGTGEFEPQLQVAEIIWRAQNRTARLGELLAFRGLTTLWQGHLSKSVIFARQALDKLPIEEIPWRSVSLSIVGGQEYLSGNIALARQIIQEALKLAETSGNRYAVRAITLHLADICVDQAELFQAAGIYRRVLNEEPIRTHPAGDLADKGRALLGLAVLSYEWNQLETAEQQAQEALSIGRNTANEWLEVRASILLAKMLLVRGETTQAQGLLHSQIASVRKLDLRRELLSYQAALRLTTEDLSAVERWATTRQPHDDISTLQLEQEELIIARLLIAQHNLPAALDLLNRLLPEAQQGTRLRTVNHCLILTALAHFVGNDFKHAIQSLRKGLEMAQSEHYQRLFLDEGEQMNELLRIASAELRSSPLFPYVRGLLLAFAEQHVELVETRESDALLSPQELRVLRLLAAGRSRPEIAQELVVSINTVKTQVNAIYRKLKVTSRKDACEMAHRLHMLS